MNAMLAAAPPDLLTLGLPLLTGALAVYCLLPRPRRPLFALGTLSGLAALGLVGWLLVPTTGFSIEGLLFYLFAAIAIASGALLVTQENPARAALAFALVVLSTSGLFLLLAAPFLMASAIVVYAGAIVVTFLFVLMLAQQEGLDDANARSREPLLATITGFVLLGALLYVLQIALEGSDNVRLADRVLAEALAARHELAQGDARGVAEFPDRLKQLINTVIDDLDRQETELQRGGGSAELRALRGRAEFARGLRERIETLVADYPEKGAAAEKQQAAIDRVVKSLAEARHQQGWLQPSGDLPLSSLSGPPSNLPADQYRTDAQGRPHLPAENTHYLGRSLFSDYLLAIELAGTLLLVAAVGAIAIAQRRGLEARQS